MSQKDRNKKQDPNNIDFEKLSNISNYIDEMMDKVKEEEMKVDLSSLDDKFMRKLGGSEFVYLTEKFNKKLDKTGDKQRTKDSSDTQQIRPSTFSWFNFALAGFLLMVIVTSGLIVYIWPDGVDVNDESSELALTELAQDTVKPKVQMRPSSVTKTGFVREDSQFVFEVEGEFESDPEEVIKITPEVPLEVETEKKGNVTILTAVPQEPLAREENYTISVEAGTAFKDGFEVVEDLEWLIPVEPHFKITASSPVDGDGNVPIDFSISISFSSDEFELEDVISSFSIEPLVEGVFEKVQEIVVFSPEAGFAPNTEYVVSVGKLFKSAEGESLEEDYQIVFTTSEVRKDADAEESIEELSWYGVKNGQMTRVVNTIFAEAKVPEGTQQVDYAVYKVLNKKHLEIMQTPNLYGTEEVFEEEIPDQELSEMDAADGIVNNSDEVVELETEEEQSFELDDIIDNSMVLAKETNSVEQPFEYTPRSPGLYLLTATVDDQTVARYFLVTSLSVVVTQMKDQMQGWIYDTQTDQERMDGLYEVYDEDGELIDSGATDDSGYFRSMKGKYLVVRYREDMDIWVNQKYGVDKKDSSVDLKSGDEKSFSPYLVDENSTGSIMMIDQSRRKNSLEN